MWKSLGGGTGDRGAGTLRGFKDAILLLFLSDPTKQLQVEDRIDFKNSPWRQRFRQGPAGCWNQLRGQMCAHVQWRLQKFQGLSKLAPERGRCVDWGAGAQCMVVLRRRVLKHQGNEAPGSFPYLCFGEPYKRSDFFFFFLRWRTLKMGTNLTLFRGFQL